MGSAEFLALKRGEMVRHASGTLYRVSFGVADGTKEPTFRVYDVDKKNTRGGQRFLKPENIEKVSQ